MRAVLERHEYTVFLSEDDCALLQLGVLVARSPERVITLALGPCDYIDVQETAERVAIVLSPMMLNVLLQMSFAVADVNGKKVWLRLNEKLVEGLSA